MTGSPVTEKHIVRCGISGHGSKNAVSKRVVPRRKIDLRLFCTDENICMEGAFFVDRADRRRSHDRVDHLHTTGKECIL